MRRVGADFPSAEHGVLTVAATHLQVSLHLMQGSLRQIAAQVLRLGSSNAP